MKCSSCGYEVNENTRHCPMCGNPIYLQEKVPVKNESVTSEQNKNVDKDIPGFKLPKIRIDKKRAVFLGLSLLAFFVLIIGVKFTVPLFDGHRNFPSFFSSSDHDDVEYTGDIIIEEGGVFYNSAGVVNDEYKDKIKKISFDKFSSEGVFTDREEDLYYIKNDLSVEKIGHAVDLGMSFNGGYAYYINGKYELKVIDLSTKEECKFSCEETVKEAVLSPNGKYICYRKRGLNKDDICAEVIVSTVDGKEVSCCQYEELYSDQFDILSVSNDGTTVFLLNSIGDVSCIYKGEMQSLFSDLKPALFLNSDMDKLLTLGASGAVSYYSPESKNSSFLTYGDEGGIYLKSYHIYDKAYVFDDNTFEGCVVAEDGKRYWLDKDLNKVPLAYDGVTKCVPISGRDGRYKFVFHDGENVHLATFENGVASDKKILYGMNRIKNIYADSDLSNIWTVNEANEIYHVTDEKADLIYQQDSGLDLSAAYDLYTDKLYFVKGRKTLFSIDSDENIKTITDECTEVKPIDDFYKYVTYTDFDISDYSIIFDNYVKKEY